MSKIFRSKEWCGIRLESEFDKKYFHEVEMYDKEDTQLACHTSYLGSITVLDRMTGFGHRDIETGYRDLHGEFWLASGNFNVLEQNCDTFGEAISLIKKRANNCVGKQYNEARPIDTIKKLEAKLIEKDKYIGTLEMMCLKYIMMDKEND